MIADPMLPRVGERVRVKVLKASPRSVGVVDSIEWAPDQGEPVMHCCWVKLDSDGNLHRFRSSVLRIVPRPMPDWGGLRQYFRSPHTGYYVGVYDGEAAGMDTEGGRWQTVCEEHSAIICHETLALARAHAPDADEWCEDCQAEAAERAVV